MKRVAIIFLKYFVFFLLCFVLLNSFNNGVPGLQNLVFNFSLSLINTIIFGVTKLFFKKTTIDINKTIFISILVILILFIILSIQEFSSVRGHWTHAHGKILEWHYNETGVFREEIVWTISILYLFITIGLSQFKKVTKFLKSTVLFFTGMYFIIVTDLIIQPRPNYGEFSYQIIETNERGSIVYSYRFFFIKFGKR